MKEMTKRGFGSYIGDGNTAKEHKVGFMEETVFAFNLEGYRRNVTSCTVSIFPGNSMWSKVV